MLRLFASVFAALVTIGGCQTGPTTVPTRTSALPPPPSVSLPPATRAEQAPQPVVDSTPLGPVRTEVLRRFEHDPNAWTQGYLLTDGRLFESTGDVEASESTLREIDPQTGAVLRQVALGEPYFAEGIERVGDQIYVLTWRDGVTFVYDLETFELTGQFSYQGEGWGLCLDEDRLVMSDGSETLTFRDPASFAVEGTLQVNRTAPHPYRLNELECVDGHVYANNWQTNEIIRIDLDTGDVASVVDAGGLQNVELGGAGNILNGIAYDRTTGTFLLTGKFWPAAFEVRFVSS